MHGHGHYAGHQPERKRRFVRKGDITPSSHAQAMKRASTSVDGYEAKGQPCGQVVCANPLCRKKWKRFTDHALSLFCPSCRQHAAKLAQRSVEAREEEEAPEVDGAELLPIVLVFWEVISGEISRVTGLPRSDARHEAAWQQFATPPERSVHTWSAAKKFGYLYRCKVVSRRNFLLCLEPLDLVDPTTHERVGAPGVKRPFYSVDWHQAHLPGEELVVLAMPNPSWSERPYLPHIVCIPQKRDAVPAEENGDDDQARERKPQATMKNHKRGGKGKTEVVRGHVSAEQWQHRTDWWGQQQPPAQSLRGPLMTVAEAEDEDREDAHREWWPDGGGYEGYEDGAWAYDWQTGGYVFVPHGGWVMPQERWPETREVGTNTADRAAPSPQGSMKGRKGKGKGKHLHVDVPYDHGQQWDDGLAYVSPGASVGSTPLCGSAQGRRNLTFPATPSPAFPYLSVDERLYSLPGPLSRGFSSEGAYPRTPSPEYSHADNPRGDLVSPLQSRQPTPPRTAPAEAEDEGQQEEKPEPITQASSSPPTSTAPPPAGAAARGSMPRGRVANEFDSLLGWILDDGSSQPTDAQSMAHTATPQQSPDARPSGGQDGVDCAPLPASPVVEREAHALRRMPSGRASIPGDKATPKGTEAAANPPSADDLPVLPISPMPEHLKADDDAARAKLSRPPGIREGAAGEKRDSPGASPGKNDKGKSVRRADKDGDDAPARSPGKSKSSPGKGPSRDAKGGSPAALERGHSR